MSERTNQRTERTELNKNSNFKLQLQIRENLEVGQRPGRKHKNLCSNGN